MIFFPLSVDIISLFFHCSFCSSRSIFFFLFILSMLSSRPPPHFGKEEIFLFIPQETIILAENCLLSSAVRKRHTQEAKLASWLFLLRTVFVFSLNSSSCVHNLRNQSTWSTWWVNPQMSRLSCPCLFPRHTAPSWSELLPFTVFSLLCPWMAVSNCSLDHSRGSTSLIYSSPWEYHVDDICFCWKKTKLFCTHTETKRTYCNNQGLLLLTFPAIFLKYDLLQPYIILQKHCIFMPLSLCPMMPHTSKTELRWHLCFVAFDWAGSASLPFSFIIV